MKKYFKTEVNIKENLQATKKKVMEFIIIEMKIFIWVNGKMTNFMVKVVIYFKKVIDMMVN